MNVGFVLPSHNYNIVLTEDDLKVLLETGLLLMRPARTEGSFHENGVSIDVHGHILRYSDPIVDDADVQFLTVGIGLDCYKRSEREKPDSKEVITKKIQDILGGSK